MELFTVVHVNIKADREELLAIHTPLLHDFSSFRPYESMSLGIDSHS